MPAGYNVIKKVVQTMKSGNKMLQIWDIKVYNTELLYSRVMNLLSMRRITHKEVLKHEMYLQYLYRYLKKLEISGLLRSNAI